MRHTGQLPLHVQVSEMLVREIQAGILLDGERLPSERQFALDLGVSIGTLRRALADLAAKGMLDRVHGSGNYVRNRTDVDNIYAFFRLELVSGGGLPTAELLTVARVAKPDHLPAFGQDSHAFRIRRLRRLNGIDAALEEIWLDGACADDIAPDSLTDSLYQFYKDRLGLVITRTEDRVSVVPCPAWSPAGFGQDQSTSWGHVERFSYDQNQRPMEFSSTWFDPATTRFIARWK